MTYQKANILTALFCYIFNRSCYVKIAVSHNMAINLQANDLKKLFEEGKYPTEEILNETKESAIKSAELLMNKILKSFALILVLLITMLVVGYTTDAIHPSLSFNIKYVLAVVGALLLFWGSLLSLGPELKTWKGKALHEAIFSIFKTFLLTMGTLSLILVFAL